VDTRNEESIDLVQSVYLIIMMVQTIPFLYERETGKSGVGKEQERKKERMREMD